MRVMNRKLFLSLITSAGLCAAVAMPAAAQPEAPKAPEPKVERPTPNLPTQQQSSIEVSDKEVQKFANVYKSTASVRQKYTKKLQNAQNRKEAQNIQRKANSEIKAAIEASPLSVQRYQEIARATAQDKELRQRILKATRQ